MSGAGDRQLPPILPEPKQALRRSGAFALRDGIPIVLESGASDPDLASALALRDAIEKRCGRKLAIETHRRTRDLGPRIELRRRGEAGEGYRIEAKPDRVVLEGTGPAGLRYAVATASQLVERRGRLPACGIDDAPDFPFRGLMLDVSRGKVPTAASLRTLVDLCVTLKLNVLMLYVEHTFRFRRHPEIGADASPLDAATLRSLDAYAAARHVDLVPSLQSLGHMDHILRLEPYRELAETERLWTLSPADERSYELLADLYDEFLPNFRSKLFNANCDESYDLGRGRSARRAEELGPGGVYLEHIRRLRDLAAAHGKRTMIWGDMVHAHPERIPELPSDLILLDWWYEAEFDYERVKRFAENGLEFVVCPGTSTWNCLFPRIGNSEENIRRYAEAGRRHGARGILVTDWGDFGHYNLQGNSWFGYAWAAQQAWSGDVSGRRFDRAFSNLLFGDASGETARLYRELGGIHDAGFRVFNGSPLQFLWFDDLERAFFIEGARPAALTRSLRRLDRARGRIAGARERFGIDELTFEELLFAADASRLAARKGLAGARYLGWRREKKLDARARRRLARELAKLASEQAALTRTLRRLWLRRSHPSDFEITKRRLDRSVRGLRRAARALERNRPPAPPPPHPGFDPGSVMRGIMRSLAED